MNFSSKLLEDAVGAFESLPGIGKKTALRLVLHLVGQDELETKDFTKAIEHMRLNIKECNVCHNISDDDVCLICTDKRRDDSLICIVESIRDIMAIEDTGQFSGKYHVLGGVISPIEGVGPNDINISTLLNRIQSGEIKEVIMAISPTIDGDTTIFYLSNQIKPFNIPVSTIARGVSFGGELEYADGVTLGRSITARTPYK